VSSRSCVCVKTHRVPREVLTSLRRRAQRDTGQGPTTGPRSALLQNGTRRL